jgi:hypothetical protein
MNSEKGSIDYEMLSELEVINENRVPEKIRKLSPAGLNDLSLSNFVNLI